MTNLRASPAHAQHDNGFVGVTLSRQEIEAVAGYKRPADQIRELQRQGFWRARLGRVTGEVILERAHFDAVAGTRGTAANDESRPQVRPLRRVK